MERLFQDLSDFGGDEMALLVVSLVVTIGGLIVYLRKSHGCAVLRPRTGLLVPLQLAWVIGYALIGLVIWRWADPQIRANVGYIFLVPLMGTAWMVINLALLRWLGINLLVDVIENRNTAASWALAGASLSLVTIYCGATVGEGPSFWNNVFSFALGTVALFGSWFLLATSTTAAVTITVERDLAAGLRASGFFVATGLVLGRAVAGDWESAPATTIDFIKTGWPEILILVVALVGEAIGRPTLNNPKPNPLSLGAVPALLYVAIAGTLLHLIGPW